VLTARRAAVGLAIIAAACGPSALERRVDRAVFAWMRCTDCMHRQLETVVALRDTATVALERILIQGPPPSHDSVYLASLLPLTAPAGGASAGTIAQHQRAFRAMYRHRALFALTAIGTPRAGDALCLARAAARSAPQRVALDSALIRINRTCP
jgi:hypothetical protein